MFTINEIVLWTGLTIFEIFTNLVALLIFSILLTLRLSQYIPANALSWFGIFSPLFCADLCNAYFCIIVAIRMHLVGNAKDRCSRTSPNYRCPLLV